MTKDAFLFVDRIKQIQSLFCKDGWITVYESIHKRYDDEVLIYCGLVNKAKIRSYRKETDWRIEPGGEGKPTISSLFHNGEWVSQYSTYDKDKIEPFIFSKSFHFDEGHDRYVDISEEFILYYKLYEKGLNKQQRTFYFIDDLGDLEEVILIEPQHVKVKLRYLKEYIAVRQIYFAVCFDIVRYLDAKLVDEDTKPIDKNYKIAHGQYNHYIRLSPADASKLQGWLRGKVILDYDKTKTNSFYFDTANAQYEQFIISYNNEGEFVYESCERNNENYFKLTYFKKEVLNKYYNDPSRYAVDGFRISSDFFSLKLDNNLDNYVAVFLHDLSSLPHKEQLHWKQYNIAPQKEISNRYYTTMIEGNWAQDAQTSDLFFKDKYEDFNQKWEKFFGWKFYKPLSSQNIHNFQALHVPTKNNKKTFCEQILALVIITIDSLNEKEIGKNLELDENDKGIKKLEKFLAHHNHPIPDMIEFLKHLQNLRSGLVAHRFSDSNKGVQKAIAYFGLSDNNYVEVANDIFIKSIFTLNTLERLFLTPRNCSHLASDF